MAMQLLDAQGGKIESIIVTGLVPDQGARHQALKIAKHYAGKRKVIDKITFKNRIQK